MDFSLTAEQGLLRDSLARWLATHHDLARSRAIAAAGGWQPELWQAFAGELGILGAALPEEVGGDGGGPVETMVIAEELGRALVTEPYVETVVLAGGVLRRCAGGADLLKGVVAGSVRVVPALLEAASGHAAHAVTTAARRDGDGWLLDGAKAVVPGLRAATHVLVSARTSGAERDLDGISLFLLPVPDLQERHVYRTIDGRHAADLSFDALRLPATALLGEEGRGWDVLSPALDEAVAAVCAEAVGALRQVLADTVAYTRRRRQFGQPLSSFQVLQHRMADMYLELEQAVSAVYLATLSLGADPERRALAVSAAKATVDRAARFVGQNAVQLHGGMGMTDELAVGHYFTRLTAIRHEYGTADTHRLRYATLSRHRANRSPRR